MGAGLLYFGGLYATTKRLATSARPGLLTVVSFAGRTLALVGAAIAVATTLGGWPLLGFAVGLTVARVALVAWARRGIRESAPVAGRSNS